MEIQGSMMGIKMINSLLMGENFVEKKKVFGKVNKNKECEKIPSLLVKEVYIVIVSQNCRMIFSVIVLIAALTLMYLSMT